MRIVRFDASARILHWSHALIFIWLLITGIAIFFTTRSLLGNPLTRMMHLYASPLFVLLPVMIYIAARNDVKELMSWSADDFGWFMGFFKMKNISVTGKYNGGQKANFMIMILLLAGLTFSGSVVWMKSKFSTDFVELNFIIHDTLAVAALLLLTGHTVLALLNFESLHGIIYGDVDENWAKRKYPLWTQSTFLTSRSARRTPGSR